MHTNTSELLDLSIPKGSFMDVAKYIKIIKPNHFNNAHTHT